MPIRRRKSLPHEIPSWVDPQKEIYFISINCEERFKNQLALPDVSKRLFETVRHRQEKFLWWPYLFLLMPDHLHALLSFPPSGKPLRLVVSKWKEWTAKQLAIHWQDDFFEHRLRQEESYREKADYILANPVRAGLITQSEEWPYLWTPDPQAHTNSQDRVLRGGAPGGRALPILIAAGMILISGCRPDMMNQPRAKPLSQSEFFKDRTSARSPPLHTVARGEAVQDDAFHTGLTHCVH